MSSGLILLIISLAILAISGVMAGMPPAPRPGMPAPAAAEAAAPEDPAAVLLLGAAAAAADVEAGAAGAEVAPGGRMLAAMLDSSCTCTCAA